MTIFSKLNYNLKQENSFTLINDATQEKFSLPVYNAVEGNPVIDIRKLGKQTGHFTFDIGFGNTASTVSNITYIDGDKGILRYRGHNIQDLVMNNDYLDTVYLLFYDQLPNETEKNKFIANLHKEHLVAEGMKALFHAFRRITHPMALLMGVIGSLSSFHPDDKISDPKKMEEVAISLIARIPTLCAWVYRFSLGLPFTYPKKKFGYTENFLHLMFSRPDEEYEVNPIVAKTLDKMLILHADHEQNASTSTVRLAISSGTNPYAAIAAGVATLWGPAHGGANEAVLKMLSEIGSIKNIDKYINKAKDKNDPFKLMGFGHRVYRNHDPRAQVIRQFVRDSLNELNIDSPKLELALALEERALNDEYFIERKLFPNLDFYSGILFNALGIPNRMLTVLFALARTSGWVAQMLEQSNDPLQKIGRPRQLYIGK